MTHRSKYFFCLVKAKQWKITWLWYSIYITTISNNTFIGSLVNESPYLVRHIDMTPSYCLDSEMILIFGDTIHPNCLIKIIFASSIKVIFFCKPTTHYQWTNHSFIYSFCQKAIKRTPTTKIFLKFILAVVWIIFILQVNSLFI